MTISSSSSILFHMASEKQIDTGTLNVDGETMNVEGKLNNYAVPLGKGVECSARGFVNIFPGLKVLTAACLACIHYPESEPDIVCEPCNPNGAFPPTLSDVLRS